MAGTDSIKPNSTCKLHAIDKCKFGGDEKHFKGVNLA
jgi:hypothetical protein